MARRLGRDGVCDLRQFSFEMLGKVLTLKYRPQTFAELLLQDHVKSTLIRAIEQKRFANAYLFAGPRGVGKTTTARIFAKSLNCLSYPEPTVTPCGRCSACVEIQSSRSMDVLEIDGASNRGIDQVRELRENVRYVPASLRFKVYIIDEVHMLTEQAFNALLKTLEEPPVHVKFIFATTAAHKVPATIISRCQRFDFRQATPEEIVARLAWLAERENITISESALFAIARRADGSIRDGESILEQLSTYKPSGVELSDVEELLGLVPAEFFFTFVDRLLVSDASGLLELIAQVVEQGYDLFEFSSGLVQHFRDLLFCLVMVQEKGKQLRSQEEARLFAQAQKVGVDRLVKIIEILLSQEETVRFSRIPRVSLECLALELAGLFVPGGCKRPQLESQPPDRTDDCVDKKEQLTRDMPRSSGVIATASRKSKSESDATGDPECLVTAPSPGGQLKGEFSLEWLWQEFCIRVRGRKPFLAKYLEQCRPTTLTAGSITIAGPEQVLANLNNERTFLEEQVSAILRAKHTILLEVERSSGEDFVQRVSRILGDIEQVQRKR